MPWYMIVCMLDNAHTHAGYTELAGDSTCNYTQGRHYKVWILNVAKPSSFMKFEIYLNRTVSSYMLMYSNATIGKFISSRLILLSHQFTALQYTASCLYSSMSEC